MQQIKLSEKALLNIKEVMAYTGWGENSVRSLLNDPKCRFVVRKGKRLFANRKLLDKYIDSISGM
ncbi:Excisionase from transposon Tn916 [Fusicatenibacter saccharivorans]|uniref:Excisionase from transposon Tn916 n=1 Tax=Fusicatenibacter saccharivorans TaxID=1150298 RepID=A0A174G4T9_9FIRM|nr:Excisionase from transposon Tn916 [Fusicatenibacter saccharivorans]